VRVCHGGYIMNIKRCKKCKTVQYVNNEQEKCTVCEADVSEMTIVPSTVKNMKEARLFELADEMMEYIDENRNRYERFFGF
jgi:hypothetical protein